VNPSELTKRLRDEGRKMMELPGLEDIGADLLAAADQLDECYKLNHFWCSECNMLVKVKPGNTVTHYCKGE
jgi:hypothetical protein